MNRPLPTDVEWFWLQATATSCPCMYVIPTRAPVLTVMVVRAKPMSSADSCSITELYRDDFVTVDGLYDSAVRKPMAVRLRFASYAGPRPPEIRSGPATDGAAHSSIVVAVKSKGEAGVVLTPVHLRDFGKGLKLSRVTQAGGRLAYVASVFHGE